MSDDQIHVNKNAKAAVFNAFLAATERAGLTASEAADLCADLRDWLLEAAEDEENERAMLSRYPQEQ